MKLATRWLGVAAVLLLAACGESTTAPESAVEDAELAGFDAALSGNGPPDRAGGYYLPWLLRQSVRQVREEQGEEAVAELTAGLRALIEEGRALRGSGDREALRSLLDAIRTATAGIVVAVLGTDVVDGALAQAAGAIAALEARAAESERPALAERRLARAQAAYEAALAARAAGDPVAALSEAAHALALATQRHSPLVRP